VKNNRLPLSLGAALVTIAGSILAFQPGLSAATSAVAAPALAPALAPSVQGDIEGKIATLSSACNTSAALTSTDNGSGGGTLTLQPKTGAANQQFRLQGAGGNLQLISAQNGLNLISADRLEQRAPVTMRYGLGVETANWKTKFVGPGVVEFSPLFGDNLRLDVVYGSTSPGTGLWLWPSNGTCAQRFQVDLVDPAPPTPTKQSDVEGKTVTLRSTCNTGAALAGAFVDPGNGTFTVQARTAAPDQQFQLRGAGGNVQIASVSSGLLVSAYDRRQNAPVTLQFGLGVEAANWKIKFVSPGIVEFSPLFADDLRIDIPGRNTTPGTGLQLYTTNGTCAQRFQIDIVS
jgi:hypothetical protein